MNDQFFENFDDQEIEQFIQESFNQNFALLRLHSGIALSPESKASALDQVLYYWRKLKHVALRVTQTEVRLSLPRQETPTGRVFGIEGIVDILREDDRTLMYDIKTHDPDYVRSHLDLYEDQLNVYAHIWINLHDQPLDGTAVICTAFPASVREAFEQGVEAVIQRALDLWDPLVEIDFDDQRVQHTIRDFGQVVDDIQDSVFTPAPVSVLSQPFAQGSRIRFATHVCRNCDARFSCDSYRKYARHGRGRLERSFSEQYADLEVGAPLEQWRSAGMQALPAEGDFG